MSRRRTAARTSSPQGEEMNTRFVEQVRKEKQQIMLLLMEASQTLRRLPEIAPEEQEGVFNFTYDQIPEILNTLREDILYIQEDSLTNIYERLDFHRLSPSAQSILRFGTLRWMYRR